jgi:hypothetical protein
MRNLALILAITKVDVACRFGLRVLSDSVAPLRSLNG